MTQVAFGLYTVGLVLIILGVSGIWLSGAASWIAAFSGFAIFILGVVLEERLYGADG